MDSKTLKFIIDTEENKYSEPSYVDIPLERPIIPVIFHYNENYSYQIIKM